MRRQVNDENQRLIPLRLIAQESVYSLGYLSILVQRKKLKAKKIGRNYFTTREWFAVYMENHSEKGEVQRKPIIEKADILPTERLQELPVKIKSLAQTIEENCKKELVLLTGERISFFVDKNSSVPDSMSDQVSFAFHMISYIGKRLFSSGRKNDKDFLRNTIKIGAVALIFINFLASAPAAIAEPGESVSEGFALLSTTPVDISNSMNEQFKNLGFDVMGNAGRKYASAKQKIDNLYKQTVYALPQAVSSVVNQANDNLITTSADVQIALNKGIKAPGVIYAQVSEKMKKRAKTNIAYLSKKFHEAIENAGYQIDKKISKRNQVFARRMDYIGGQIGFVADFWSKAYDNGVQDIKVGTTGSYKKTKVAVGTGLGMLNGSLNFAAKVLPEKLKQFGQDSLSTFNELVANRTTMVYRGLSSRTGTVAGAAEKAQVKTAGRLLALAQMTAARGRETVADISGNTFNVLENAATKQREISIDLGNKLAGATQKGANGIENVSVAGSLKLARVSSALGETSYNISKYNQTAKNIFQTEKSRSLWSVADMYSKFIDFIIPDSLKAKYALSNQIQQQFAHLPEANNKYTSNSVGQIVAANPKTTITKQQTIKIVEQKTGDIQVAKEVGFAKNLTVENLTVTAALTVKTLTVTDAANFLGQINATDIFANNMQLRNSLNVVGDSSIQGNERIGGNLVVEGTFSAGHTQFSSLGVSGQVGAGSLSSGGSLVVAGDTSLNGDNIYIKGAVDLNNTLDIDKVNEYAFTVGSTDGNDNLKVDTKNGIISISGTTNFSGLTTFMNGNVGIGTTSPFALLSVAGNGYFDGNVTVTNLFATSSVRSPYYVATDEAATSTFAGGFSAADTLYVLQYGEGVGIGTSTPQYMMDVNGSLRTVGNAYFNSSVGVASSTPSSTFSVDGSAWFTGETLLATNSGYVGIANNAPHYNLDVTGNGHFTSYVDASYFTATSTTATSTFAGGITGPNDFTVQQLSGYVGIANASPTYNLDVIGNGHFTSFVDASYFTATSTTATSTLAGGFAVAGNRLVYDWQTGNIGVNTDSPVYGLDVNGTMRTTGIANFDNNIYLGNATSSDIVYLNSRIGTSIVPTVDNALDLGDGDNWLRWRTGYFGTSVGIAGTATSTGTSLLVNGSYLIDSGSTLSINTDNNQQVIFGSGNIGIGNSSPTYNFDVTGNGHFTSYVDASYFTATSTNATSTFAGGIAADTNGFVYDWQTGNVGINTASPAYRLTVEGIGSFGDYARASYFTATSSSATSTFAGGITGPNNFTVQQSSGNVGIGTVSPNNKLTVSGGDLELAATTGQVRQIIFSNVGGGAYPDVGGAARIKSAQGDFYWQAAGGDAMQLAGFHEIILQGGRNVSDDLDFISGNGSAYNTRIINSNSASVGLSLEGAAGQTGDYLQITANGGTAGAVFKVTSDGKIGIGTDNPTVNFHMVANTDLSVTPDMRFEQKGTGRAVMTVIAPTGDPQMRVGDGTNWWAWGMDNNDNDKFILAYNSLIGTNDLLAVDTSGNVGIGVSSPYTALHVSGSNYYQALFKTSGTVDRTSTIQIENNNDVSRKWDVGVGGTGNGVGLTSGQFYLYDYGVNLTRFAIDNNGNVGIGNTSPTYRLDVSGNAHFTQLVDASNFVATSTTATSTFAGGFTAGNNAALTVNYAAPANSIYVNSAGNVGIGTNNPGRMLEVKSNSSDTFVWRTVTNDYVAGSIGSSFNFGFGATTGDTYAKIQAGITGGNGIGNIVLEPNGGNVGIGNTSPTYKLDVTGNGHFTQLVDASNFVATSTTATSTFAGGFTAGNNAALTVNYAAPANSIYVNPAGNVGIGTTSPAQALAVSGTAKITGTTYFGPSNAYFITDTGNIGASSNRWDTIYVDNLNASNVYGVSYDIGGTTGNDITINTDNNTADLQDMSIAFERGSEMPNATLLWDASADNFNFNFPLYVDNAASNYFAGNVGIGNPGPTYKLDVTGNGHFTSYVDASYFVATSTSATSTFAGGLAVETNGLVYDYSTNNVGIGTTSPFAKLSVAGNIYADGTITVSNLVATSSISAPYFIATDANATSTFAGGITGPNNFTVQQSSGNVGIGTAAPDYKLDIQNLGATTGMQIKSGGAANIVGIDLSRTSVDATIGIAGAAGQFSDFSMAGGDMIIRENTGNLILTARNASGNILFGSGSSDTEKVRITSGGNVGIGNTAPTYKLDVTGNGHFTQLVDASNFVATSTTATSTFAGGFTAGNNAALTVNYAAPAGSLYVNPAGYVGIGTTNPTQSLTVYSNSTNPVIEVSAGASGSFPLFKLTDGRTSGTNWNIENGRNGSGTGLGFWDSSGAPGSRLFIQNGGNVGIGTTDPKAKLNIVDTVAQEWSKPLLIYNPNIASGQHVQIGFGVANSSYNQAEFNFNYVGGAGSTNNTFSLGLHSAADILTMKGTGNVGIDNATPTYKLDVTGNGHFTQLIDASNFVATSTTATSTFAGGFTAGNNAALTVNYAAPANSIYVNPAGNVGIGTAAPGAKLQVGSTAADYANSDKILVGGLRQDNTRKVLLELTRGQQSGYYYSGGVGFLVSSDDVGVANTNVTHLDIALRNTSGDNLETIAPVMSLKSNGNVGIGTTSPFAKLSVAGNIYADGSITVSNLVATSSISAPYFTATDASATSTFAGGFTAGNNAALTVNYAAPAGSLYVNPAGNVGIGTNNPTASLYVQSPTSGTAFSIQGNSTFWTMTSTGMTFSTNVGGTTAAGQSASNYFNNFNNNTAFLIKKSSTGTGDYLAVEDSSSNPIFYVKSSGNVGIGTTSPFAKLSVAGNIYADGSITVSNLVATSSISAPYFTATDASATSTFAGGITGPNNFTVQQSSGYVGIGTASPRTKFDVTSGNSNTDGDAPSLAVFTGASVDAPSALVFVQSNTQQDTGQGGSIGFGGRYITDNTGGAMFASIKGAKENATSNNLSGYLSFSTRLNGTAFNVNSERMRITSAGNVGIGTTSPFAKLSVAGNIYADGTLTVSGLTATSSISAPYFTATSATATSTFAGGITGPNNFTIQQSSGYVGIGTASPLYPLHVNGVIYSNNGIYGASNIETGSAGNFYWQGRSRIYSPADGQITFLNNAENGFTRLNLGGTTSSFPALAVNGSDLQIIRADGSTSANLLVSGKIGIANTSPSYSLDVTGNGHFTQLVDASNFVATSTTATSTFAGGFTAGNNAALTVNYAAPAGSLYVNPSGNVGIGTTNPAAKLDVYGGNLQITQSTNTGFNGLLIYESAGGSNGAAIRRDAGVNGNLAFRNQGIDTLMLNNGNVGIGTTSPFAKLSVAGNIYADGNLTVSGLTATSSISAPYFTATDASATSTFAGGFSAASSLYVLQNGNMGVGLTNPSQKLSVNGGTTGGIEINAQAPTLYFTDSNGGQQSGFVRYDNGSWDFYTSSSRMTVGTNAYIAGNLGLENTAPTYKLDVTGNGHFTQLVDAANFVATSTTATSTFAGGLVLDTNGLVYDYSSNRVGIGTASPAHALDVYTGTTPGGIISLLKNSSNTDTALQIQNSVAAWQFSVRESGDSNPGGFNFYYSSDGSTDWVNAMNLTTGGNVSIPSGTLTVSGAGNSSFAGNLGIGTASPSELLHLYGSSKNLMIDDSGAGTSGIKFATAGATKAVLTTNFGTGEIKFGGVGAAYFPTFYSGNAEVMRITSSGNVGIGTTSPFAKLSVAGNIYADGSITVSNLIATSSISAPYFTATDAAATSTFAGGITGPNNFTVQQSSGNVGIGTTNPGSALDVVGSVGLTQGLLWKLNNTTAYTNASYPSIYSSSGTGAAYPFTGVAGNLVLEPRLNGATRDVVIMGASAVPVAVFQGSGNVGIGTTTPAQKLHVQGAISSGDLSDGAMITYASGVGRILGVDAGYAGWNDLDIRSSSATQLYLTTGGNVGIGTTSPVSKLQVDGNIALAGRYNYLGNGGVRYIGIPYQNDFDSGAGAYIGFTQGGTSGLSNDIRFYTHKSGASAGERMRIDEAGNVGIGTTTPSAKLQVYSSATNSFVVGSGYIESTGAEARFYGTGASDPASGIGSVMKVSAASGIGLAVGGTSYFNGNVGIGTTSPFAKLSVAGNIYADGNLTVSGLTATSSISAPYFTATSASATSTFAGGITGPNNFTVQQSSGNVGIGTTEPREKLDVNGNIRLSSSSGSIKNVYSLLGRESDSVLHIAGNTSYAGNLFLNYSGGTVSVGDNVAGVFRVNTNSLYVTASGNVGIGNTSPTYKLDVTGNGHFTQLVDAANFVATSTTATSTFAGGFTAGNNAALTVNYAAPANSIYVNPAGYVGIGTTAPLQNLDIAGGSLRIGNDNLNIYTGTLRVLYGTGGSMTIGSSSWGGVTDFVGTGGTVMRINVASGNVGIGSTTPGALLAVGNNFAITSAGTIIEGGWNGSTIGVGYGGTGVTSIAQDNILYASSANTYSATSLTAFGRSLIDDASASAARTTLGVTIGTDVQGYDAGLAALAAFNTNGLIYQTADNTFAGTSTLSVGYGGTGATTLTGMLKGNGNAAFTGVTGTQNYATYWSDANTIAAEQYLNVSRGGTGIGEATAGYTLIGGPTASALQATSTLYVKSNGNVGIGTTNPGVLLSLGTNLADKKLLLYDDSTYPYGFGIQNAEFRQFFAADGHLSIGTYTGTTFAEKVRIQNGGNVGIGTTTPIGKLTVESTTSQLVLAYDDSNYTTLSTNSSGILTISGTAAGVSGGDVLIGDVGSASNLVFEESAAITGQGANTVTLGTSGDTFNLNQSGVTYNIGVGDNTRMYLGASNDASLAWDTAATPNTLNVSGYTRFGAYGGTTNPSGIGAPGEGDVLITSDLEVNGVAYLAGGTAWTQGDIAEKMSARALSSDELSGAGADTSYTGMPVAGDIVVADQNGSAEVVKSYIKGSSNIIGVVSTRPAGILFQNMSGVEVGLTGTVPVKVCSENGEIKKGDKLAVSSIPGTAMKSLSGSDSVVGVALENWDGQSATVKMLLTINNRLSSNLAESAGNTSTLDVLTVNNYLTVNGKRVLTTDDLAGIASSTTVTTTTTTVNNNTTIDSIDASLIVSGVIDAARISGDYSGITKLGNLLGLNVTGDSLLTGAMSIDSGNYALKIDELGGIRIGTSAAVSATSTIGAVVEIVSASTTPQTAFVVNQETDATVADFQADGVSIMSIADNGKVKVMGEMLVDGRIMVCAGGVCSTALDSAVDETLGDIGVEGKVVAGSFEGYCEDGFVWVPGSAKYGTLPGFCVMADIAKKSADPEVKAPVLADAAGIWTDVTQGEAQMACRALGSEYHLLSENEWLTIADNVLKVNANDSDEVTDGMQLNTSTESEITYKLTNDNVVTNLVGTVSEWTEQTVTSAGNVSPASDSWMEYSEVEDYKGFNIAPSYYYTSANGIGKIKTGLGGSALRGFVRGEGGVYGLDLSHSPSEASAAIGFRCAK